MVRTHKEADIYEAAYGVRLPNSDYQPAAVVAMLENKDKKHPSKAAVHKTLMDFLRISRGSVAIIIKSALANPRPTSPMW